MLIGLTASAGVPVLTWAKLTQYCNNIVQPKQHDPHTEDKTAANFDSFTIHTLTTLQGRPLRAVFHMSSSSDGFTPNARAILPSVGIVGLRPFMTP